MTATPARDALNARLTAERDEALAEVAQLRDAIEAHRQTRNEEATDG